jgi:death-on-curing protein
MTQWVWLDERDARTIHERLLALHGGAEGVRDAGLLESALARPQQLAAYGDNPDVSDLAAAYTAGIVKNHPFIDGNKRTGFVLGILFLEINGMRFTASEESATQAVLDLAAGTTDMTGYAAFLRESITQGEA